MAAFSKVTSIIELFENILQELPFQQLFIIQRVSKVFKATIMCSTPLRRAMFLEAASEKMQTEPLQQNVIVDCLSPFVLWHSARHVTFVIDPENARWGHRGGSQSVHLFGGCYPCERLQTWRSIKVGQGTIKLEESAFLLGSIPAGEKTTLGDAVDWAMSITIMVSRFQNERTRMSWEPHIKCLQMFNEVDVE